MTIQCAFIALLTFPLAIYSSEESQAPGTITNITPSDMKLDLYEHPYPPSFIGILGFKYGQRQKDQVSHIGKLYINAQEKIRFDENLAGVSLPTKQNPNPDIYLIDQQHAYTLVFNKNGKRILTTTENGKIKEPITFEEKNRANSLSWLVNECINTNQIHEIEKKLGLTNNNKFQKMLTLAKTQREKPTAYKVEKAG